MPRTIKKRSNINPLSVNPGSSSTASSISPAVTMVRSGVDWYKKKLRKGSSGTVPGNDSGPLTYLRRGGK